MTGDDLRAVPEWVDWQSNPPKVTIPAATRDALADVLDAARAFVGVPAHLDPGECRVCNLFDALDALDALDADQ